MGHKFKASNSRKWNVTIKAQQTPRMTTNNIDDPYVNSGLNIGISSIMRNRAEGKELHKAQKHKDKLRQKQLQYQKQSDKIQNKESDPVRVKLQKLFREQQVKNDELARQSRMPKLPDRAFDSTITVRPGYERSTLRSQEVDYYH